MGSLSCCKVKHHPINFEAFVWIWADKMFLHAI
uniref:Uncharacterized protein n=1 Tax=Anguilla anguilla TaxID=7936 RepID=A0A0E9VKQ6_ANGAN